MSKNFKNVPKKSEFPIKPDERREDAGKSDPVITEKKNVFPHITLTAAGITLLESIIFYFMRLNTDADGLLRISVQLFFTCACMAVNIVIGGIFAKLYSYCYCVNDAHIIKKLTLGLFISGLVALLFGFYYEFSGYGTFAFMLSSTKDVEFVWFTSVIVVAFYLFVLCKRKYVIHFHASGHTGNSASFTSSQIMLKRNIRRNCPDTNKAYRLEAYDIKRDVKIETYDSVQLQELLK